MTDTVTTRLSPRNLTFGCTHMTSDDDCGGPARWVRTADVDGERMVAGWSGDAFCDVHRPDVDPRHARMSAAIVDWLGDAVSDYARALLADDMAALDQALAEHDLVVVGISSGDGDVGGREAPTPDGAAHAPDGGPTSPSPTFDPVSGIDYGRTPSAIESDRLRVVIERSADRLDRLGVVAGMAVLRGEASWLRSALGGGS